MTDSISKDIDLLDGELIALRRDIHRHPELGFTEVRTSAIAVERLRELGLSVRAGVAETGIIADLEGEHPGGTILLRADMDALPVEERSGRDFASVNPGVMHACGHDAHVSALLGAAKLLAARRDRIAGRVRFLFQPAEELAGGALKMIEGGALEGVDKVIGAHVFSPFPFGVVATRPGPFFAGIDAFELAIIGRAGHGGMPHMSVDPIVAAAHVVTALQSIVSRETRPGDPLVVSVSAISGGQAPNVVVERVTLRGTVRWYSQSNREHALDRIAAIASGVCSAMRARSELTITTSAPVTVNAAGPVDLVTSAVNATGRASVMDPGPLTVSEDFSEYSRLAPGCLFAVGAGGATAAPHHHHAFDIDERSIGLTAEIFVRAALDALRPE
ncbi:MAG: amidohydrolase [Polyangiaceae bacterium]|nr:amidohydrolase [Polyangiaceae bacterium]NUQ72295.1 amidohydrolase [Polyangiaceae bacterium]